MITKGWSADGNGLLYTYYGDDFTGSTDVLEALALHGIPAVLFTHPPEDHELRAFAGCRAVGIAGESRSRSPEWMTQQLPAIFARMRELGAPINHYKVCSTFDSAPHIGSIGRAMELGSEAFDAQFIPVVVGAPRLGRYVLFANLFATAAGVVYRIDRHPTMRRHPITPMNEADLRLHLAAQTSMPLGLVDLVSLQAGLASSQLQKQLEAGAKAVIFDGFSDFTLNETARLIWNFTETQPVFAVGSSGLAYGLIQLWQQLGLNVCKPENFQVTPTDRLLVLSGSCSPGTETQIRHALQHGFWGVDLMSSRVWEAKREEALTALSSARSVILYTALGPQSTTQELEESMKVQIGEWLQELVLLSGVRRIVIAGGDTSTRAVMQLGLSALTFVAPLAPGAPLCRGHATGSRLDGLELVLKGGQIGPEDFFTQVLFAGR